MDKPTLTVMFRQMPADLLASGVVADEDLFRNVRFGTLDEALKYMQNRYQSAYKVILNIPSNVKRNP
jgi:hypothetical protein